MSAFTGFIKRNVKAILHILITGILYVLFALFFTHFPDYKWLLNISLSLLCVYYIYKIFFKKIFVDSFGKILCILALLTAVNGLYSYKKFIATFPQFEAISQSTLLICFISLLIVLLLILKLFSFLEPGNSSTPQSTASKSPNGDTSASKVSSVAENKHTEQPQDSTSHDKISLNNSSREEFYSFLKFLIGLVIVIIFLIVPVVLLKYFNANETIHDALDFDQIFSIFTSYGLSFLLILFALIVAVIVLISLAKYILIQVHSLKNVTENDIKSAYPVPTYAFSIIIVCVILFLAWRASDFSLEDLTNKLVIGNYLALPIAVIVFIVLFFLLVQLVHAIILMLSNMTSVSIKHFEKKLRIASRLIKIIQFVIDIILDTVISTLEFVKFVPNFFSDISNMILKEEGEEIDADYEVFDCDDDGFKDGEGI